MLWYKILNIGEGHYKSELDLKIWKLGTKYISNLICVSLQFNFDHGQELLQHLRLQHWPDTLHVQLLCHLHLLLLLLRLLRLPLTRQLHLQHLLLILFLLLLLLLLGLPNHPSNRPPHLPYLLRLPILFQQSPHSPRFLPVEIWNIDCCWKSNDYKLFWAPVQMFPSNTFFSR